MGSQDILTSIEGNLLGLDVNHNLMVLGLSFMSSPGVGLGSKVVMAAQAAAHTYSIPDKGANGTFQISTATLGTNGIASTKILFFDFRNADGSALAAAAAAGKFGQTVTLGTVQRLVSESANNNTKTDDAIFSYILPSGYVPGAALTVTVNASITGAGTLTTKTVQVKAYKVANDGTMGTDISTGVAVAMTAAGADVPFAITTTGLVAGDKLLFELETVLTETAASGMVANINSVRIS